MPKKAYVSRFVKEAGRLSVVSRFVSKADVPMVATLEPSVSDAMGFQPNACSPMEMTEFGTTSVEIELNMNALWPIDTSESPRVTEVRPCEGNAPSSTLVTGRPPSVVGSTRFAGQVPSHPVTVTAPSSTI